MITTYIPVKKFEIEILSSLKVVNLKKFISNFILGVYEIFVLILALTWMICIFISLFKVRVFISQVACVYLCSQCLTPSWIDITAYSIRNRKENWTWDIQLTIYNFIKINSPGMVLYLVIIHLENRSHFLFHEFRELG